MTKDRNKVLVIDDDAEVCECVRMALEMKGYGATIAQNGEEALALMSNFKPDLIICDIDMPELDGFHFAERIKRNKDWLHIPVIMISGLTKDSKQSESVWAQRLGVDVFFGKPFDPFKLVAKVKELLEKEDE